MGSNLKSTIRGALLGLGIAAVIGGGVALAAGGAFNLFQPANGILVGNPSTYITTAATSANVVPLWAGTCNNTTYLRGDGQCAAPPGTGGGTVSSVGLTMPSGFSVGGSPVTGSSVLAVTTVLSGVLKGTGSGFTIAVSSDVTALWSGTCSSSTFLRGDGACAGAGAVTSVALADGSTTAIFNISGSPVTGSGTLTETLNTQSANTVLAGPSSGSAAQPAFRALVAADIPPISLSTGVTGSLPFASLTISSANVIGLWSGTCSSSTYLRGDGSCVSPGGGGTVTSVGLSAPSIFTVGGTPVTGSGTLALTFAGGQTANEFLASPDGLSGAIGLRSIVAGDLPGSITSNTSGNAATATLASTVTLTSSSTNTAYRLALANGSSILYGASGGTFNPSTGVLSATTFSGAGTSLTGTASGLSIGGNAATATLATGITLASTSTNANYNVGLVSGSSVLYAGLTYNPSTANLSTGTISVTPTSAVNAGIFNGFSGAPANIELVDGQSGNIAAYIQQGYCNGSAPGILGIFNNGSTRLCVAQNGGVYTPSATGGSEGNGTINAQGVYVNGLQVLTTTSGSANKIASAGISGTSSTCAIANNGGGIASCAINGTGQWSITFTTSFFANTPICLVSGNNAAVANNGVFVSSPSSSSFDVVAFTTTTGAVLASSNFYIVCVGS